MITTEVPPKPRLERELRYFEQHRSELLGHARAKYALIKDDSLIDVFDSQADAIRRGYQEFGNQPFLVKLIVDVELPLEFSSHTLGF